MSTLGTLRAQVAINLGDPNLTFYTVQELNQYIGEAYQNYSLMLMESGEGYFVWVKQLGFTANQENIDLSTLDPPFFSVSKFLRNTSTGTIPLIESPMRFTQNSTILTSTGNAYLPKWFLRSLNLVLQPYPQYAEPAPTGPPYQTGFELDYIYVPVFPVASSPDDFSFDNNFPLMFEPLITLYATISALETKDGMGGVSDINSFRGRLQKWETTLEESLQRSEFPDRVNYMGVDYANMNNWRY